MYIYTGQSKGGGPRQRRLMSQGQGSAGVARPMVVDAPLCFMLSKWGRLPQADLKDLAVGFYTAEQIFTSKELLSLNLVALKIEGIPQLKLRRIAKGTAELRNRKEIEDLVELISFSDDKRALGLLDKYVTDNADAIPSPRICESDLIAIMRKLNSIENHCNELQDKLDKVTDVSRATTLAVEKLNTNKEPPPNISIGGPWNSNLPRGGLWNSDIFCRNHNATSSLQSAVAFTAKLTQHPAPSHLACESVMSESDGAATMSESEFTAVENRKTRRLNKRARTATSSPVYMTAAQIVANGNGASSNNTLQATGPVAPTASHLAGQNKKANDRIVMVGRSTTSRMTAAVKLTTPKEVFRISNIDGAFTAKDMEDYLEFIGVHVQTCFDRTPLVARKKNNKVFRVCILSIDKDKLLSENNWSRGIIIQKWIFNTGKDARGQGGDVPPPLKRT